jgi:hypothetical protein
MKTPSKNATAATIVPAMPVRAAPARRCVEGAAISPYRQLEERTASLDAGVAAQEGGS